MRKLVLYPLSSLATFAVGVCVVGTIPHASSSIPEDNNPQPLEIHTLRPRFTLSGGMNACGPDIALSTESYETNDGRTVTHIDNSFSTEKAARKNLKVETSVYSRIVGALGSHEIGTEKYLLFLAADGENMARVRILSYPGGAGYEIVEAPDLSLALEFEQYLSDRAASRFKEYSVRH